MTDPVSRSLESLAIGLRPFVAARVTAVLRNENLAADVADWDAQGLLFFLWERWNDLFRSELSFVERCLVSELREFRNRWAHQSQLCEKDTYRILDGIERLLFAVNSPEHQVVSTLRKESLNRLWTEEFGATSRTRMIRFLWPYVLCTVSALAISAALVIFVQSPWSWILSMLVLIATLRIAWMQSNRESTLGLGPRECSQCGRIVYSIDCPYCHQVQHHRFGESKDGNSPARLVTGTWAHLRRPPGTSLASREQGQNTSKRISSDNGESTVS